MVGQKIRKTAQAVIYNKFDGEAKFLLLKRQDKYSKESLFRLVKGGIEESETPEQTIIREIQEETGLTKVQIIKEIGGHSYKAQGEVQEVKAFLVLNTEKEETKIDSSLEEGFVIEEIIWLRGEDAVSKLTFEEEKGYIKSVLKEV
jgi:8-oxo-dGTP pyrophosphatase MutT (NUDIX family)